MNHRKYIHFLFFSLVFCNCSNHPTNLQSSMPQMAIIAAGHTYGSHTGNNHGLYPKFLSHIQKQKDIHALFLVGDIVRESNDTAWQQITKEVTSLSYPTYFVMGNHDYTDEAIALFNQQYGNTYYSFSRHETTFIILDCQKDWGRITEDQIEFLKKVITENSGSKNFFIFFHELIWTQGKDEYKPVNHNWGSYEGKFVTNFWEDLFPLITIDSLKSYYIIAGDVGGNPGKIPAFYQKLGNVTLIATGMGEIRDENYLHITISHSSEVTLELIPLNEINQLKELPYYCLENLPPR